jgi:ribosomal protein S27E
MIGREFSFGYFPKTAGRWRSLMSDQHCPGFEANKTLSAVTVRCPECGKEWEIFSDELEKSAKCAACGAVFDPQSAKVA